MPGRGCTAWLAEREADLLPVPYYHVVFTLPAPVADIAYQNKAVVYDLLLRTAAETLITIAADPRHLGARIGLTAVLHTWGSALTHHPHVHMIVPGGGLSPDGSRWVACRLGFFLPVRVLSRLFRRLFLDRLAALHEAGRLVFFGDQAGLADRDAFAAHLAPLRSAEWVVYAKRPFGGPEAVLAYLSRYTHRVAISNSRLVSCDESSVTFRWKDYRARGKGAPWLKTMTLAADTFIPPLPDPCPAQRLPPHPPLRPVRQRHPGRRDRPHPCLALRRGADRRRSSAGDGSGSIATAGPAVPLLRRAHDGDRGLRQDGAITVAHRLGLQGRHVMTRSPPVSTERWLLAPSHGCVRSDDTSMRAAAGSGTSKTIEAGNLNPANTASTSLANRGPIPKAARSTPPLQRFPHTSGHLPHRA